MPESQPDLATSTDERDAVQALQAQVASLHLILVAALMALLLLSVGVNIFLFRQVDMVSKELGIAARVIRDYETHKRPLINSFVSNLVVYAKTHQDFNPVLQEFGLPPPAAPPATPPASAPEPSPKK